MEKAAGSHNSHSKSSGRGVCVFVHPCPNSMSLLVYDGMDEFVFMCVLSEKRVKKAIFAFLTLFSLRECVKGVFAKKNVLFH